MSLFQRPSRLRLRNCTFMPKVVAGCISLFEKQVNGCGICTYMWDCYTDHHTSTYPEQARGTGSCVLDKDRTPRTCNARKETSEMSEKYARNRTILTKSSSTFQLCWTTGYIDSFTTPPWNFLLMFGARWTCLLHEIYKSTETKPRYSVGLDTGVGQE